MTQIRLSDIYLGVNDGKKEALYRNDFEKFFVDYNNNYADILKPQKYIILGRKGSGKTILAEFIKKQSESDPIWFCEIKSYKDFRFHELVNFKTNDISPNEYTSIWRWIVLIDFAKLIIEDNGIQDTENKRKLEKFFRENYYSLDIDAKKVIEITKGGKINGKILKEILDVGAEVNKQTKFTESSYLTYLEDLEKVVIKLLNNSNSNYTLIYDELDDRFQNDSFYKNSIISLIKTADSLNCAILEKRIKAKVILLIRSDIFSILNDTDLNKIKLTNTVSINWGDKVSPDSPLIHLIVQKAKRSTQYLNQFSDKEIFETLFPQNIKGVSPDRFILERTLFRPRDIITFLNLIIEKYPFSNYFGWKGFVELKAKYSEYFYDEIRNEMLGHISQEEIDQGLRLLKNFNKHFFHFDELNTYYERQKKHYPNIDLEKLLISFFKFNVIGNKWHNSFKNKEYYTWSHRDTKAEIDFDKQIVVHLALREQLSM
ncbi:hypothetical protein EFA69_09240 [Rufibacter immobilis]|uniref:Uncharacterized protein n=1 Tax=Rufibacter immobilis TaxID=1348778 RepID=A0A3M9MW08_9BACT|nr:hypothetical protein [Rufibacter immobilis]RNI29724.1 hypothetical protein EFA69_09240 [Rufibacter immobilis]